MKRKLSFRALFSGKLLLAPMAAALLLFAAPISSGETGEIHVGAPLSLTGKYIKEGTHVRNGYDLAIRQINRLGGVEVGGKWYKFKLHFFDDVSHPDRAAEIADRLINEVGVQFMLGPYSSTLTRAVQEVTQRHRMPLIQANGAARSLLGQDFHFAILSPANFYLSKAVDYFAERVAEEGESTAEKTAGLIFQRDSFSQDVRLGVLERLEHHGIQTVLDERFPDALDDIGRALQSVKDLKPDLLLISGHAKGALTAVRQITELQVEVPMIAMTQCDAAQIEVFEPDGAEYVMCSKQWHKDLGYRDPLFGSGQDFVRLFNLSYGYEPPYHAAESAAAVQVLADALHRAGTLDSGAVRDAIAATDMRTFYGDIKFDSDGSNAAKGMVLSQVLNGEYILVSPPSSSGPEAVYPAPAWNAR